VQNQRWMGHDNENENGALHSTFGLLEKHLTRANRAQNQRQKQLNRWWSVIKMGRISVELPEELEKKLRFKTIERFGGRKGDLSRAVEEAVKIWVAKEK